jgi:hypothetical protein
MSEDRPTVPTNTDEHLQGQTQGDGSRTKTKPKPKYKERDNIIKQGKPGEASAKEEDESKSTFSRARDAMNIYRKRLAIHYATRFLAEYR